jgi:hypothetical protein
MQVRVRPKNDKARTSLRISLYASGAIVVLSFCTLGWEQQAGVESRNVNGLS